jgi:hypothetical protein
MHWADCGQIAMEMANDAKVPEGQRFTHVYAERGKPVDDSPRVRRRLAAIINEMPDAGELPTLVPRELGIDFVWAAWGPNWPVFLNQIEVADLLDLITVTYRYLTARKRGPMRDPNANAHWLAQVRRIFEEENFGYSVDDAGGVHYRLDEEFARNQSATIAALQSARYANSLDGFQKGMAALAGAPPDGKGAIRATFAAVEGLFKLMVPKAARLGAAELDDLMPLLDRQYSADATALRSSNKMLRSLKEWVDAAHFYRHEQGSEQIAQPPQSLAIYLTALGPPICAGSPSWMQPHQDKILASQALPPCVGTAFGAHRLRAISVSSSSLRSHLWCGRPGSGPIETNSQR